MLDLNGLDKYGADTIEPWRPGDPTNVLLWGSEGVGKSHFWMTAPDPLIAFDFEHNLHETLRGVQKLDPEKSIKRFPYMVPPLEDRLACKIMGDKLVKDVNIVLDFLVANKAKATFVFDTVTNWWEIFRFAYVPLDDKGRAMQREYGPAVGKANGILQKIKAYGHSIIMVARAKPYWLDNKDTGLLCGDYYKAFGYAASAIIEISKTPSNERQYRIVRCKANERAEQLPALGELDYPGLLKVIEAV